MGAALIAYLYHVRPVHIHDTQARERITSWPAYEYVDWYLKISTLAVLLASIHTDHPLLLKTHDSLVLRLIGLSIAGTSLLLFSAAMWTLDRQYTPAHASHLPTEIIMRGPYRFIRHPIYTANLMLLVGVLVASGSIWIVLNLLILVCYYLPTIMREEAAISRRFPEYRQYAARTGRFFPKLRATPPRETDGLRER